MNLYEDKRDPDLFLKQIMESEKEQSQKGRLKIFFGYAAGIGKTYAMLSSAHKAKESGIDVVAGYIEPHTRPETRHKCVYNRQCTASGEPERFHRGYNRRYGKRADS